MTWYHMFGENLSNKIWTVSLYLQQLIIVGEHVKAQPETGFVCKAVRVKYIDTNLKPKAGYAVNSPCI